MSKTWLTLSLVRSYIKLANNASHRSNFLIHLYISLVFLVVFVTSTQSIGKIKRSFYCCDFLSSYCFTVHALIVKAWIWFNSSFRREFMARCRLSGNMPWKSSETIVNTSLAPQPPDSSTHSTTSAAEKCAWHYFQKTSSSMAVRMRRNKIKLV
jgi:hypothetical protein